MGQNSVAYHQVAITVFKPFIIYRDNLQSVETMSEWSSQSMLVLHA